MSAYGYEQTLGDRRCEVRFPLRSRRKHHQNPNMSLEGLLSAPKRTSRDYAVDVWF